MEIIPGHSYMYTGNMWFKTGAIIVALPNKSPRGNHKYYERGNPKRRLYVMADELAPLEAENE